MGLWGWSRLEFDSMSLRYILPYSGAYDTSNCLGTSNCLLGYNKKQLGDLYFLKYQKKKKKKNLVENERLNLKLRWTWKFKRLERKRSRENGWMSEWNL